VFLMSEVPHKKGVSYERWFGIRVLGVRSEGLGFRVRDKQDTQRLLKKKTTSLG